MSTTSCNSTDLDMLLPVSSHQMDGADLDDDGKDTVPVGTSIFGPFNSLTTSNLKILHRQQISKGIREGTAKVRDLRAFLRTLQVRNPDFALESKYGVGAAAYKQIERKVCEPTHLIMESLAYSAVSHKTTASRARGWGLMTPQSLEEQDERDPFVLTPAPQSSITPDVIPEPPKPLPTISGSTGIDSATTSVPVATRKEKAVLSWLGSIPEDNTISSADTKYFTFNHHDVHEFLENHG